ncbi:hypothetical protein [Pseudemcibacter aquimaris]|uniref:hypothetical protein n=1 Tax=Pseudemcibacter aquimaris TaxID=2857064 RepID=UPI0020130ADA|nr:hypothetical protein [Pseudemcibacter aquimaris]MCC3859604.1 hypothetical protein [Pseudemcibacter aquimaris]WDU60000.1 hypothetical protein KW060_06985 [Pseudemcibacter aquimaris]
MIQLGLRLLFVMIGSFIVSISVLFAQQPSAEDIIKAREAREAERERLRNIDQDRYMFDRDRDIDEIDQNLRERNFEEEKELLKEIEEEEHEFLKEQVKENNQPPQL